MSAERVDATRARPGRPGQRVLLRFDRVERTVHWVNASLFLVLLLTGAALYFTPLIALVGRRRLIEQVHLYAGLALPLPVLLALAGSWGRGLRRDVSRINVWTEADLQWLRGLVDAASGRGQVALRPRLGKFNAGQKLNAAFVVGGGLVMLGTGALLHWYIPFPVAWRAGATFVHNWLAVGFALLIAGHITLALADREALRAMFGGRVSRTWAARHAPAWLEESAEQQP
ncbi:MAG TPA: cytochrome b/b6 domain-containing protein [Solirubrobacteraceae bacterium]|nr:cytochrome b/b6 domain-containing protein [Solirubrobacteraceae bacterium]